jgi:hypothetical protein
MGGWVGDANGHHSGVLTFVRTTPQNKEEEAGLSTHLKQPHKSLHTCMQNNTLHALQHQEMEFCTPAR